MVTIKEIREFDEWYKKNNPTADEMNNYWKEKNKNKLKQKVDYTYGLDSNYQGFGNGHYTMEEYAEYELNKQNIR